MQNTSKKQIQDIRFLYKNSNMVISTFEFLIQFTIGTSLMIVHVTKHVQFWFGELLLKP